MPLHVREDIAKIQRSMAANGGDAGAALASVHTKIAEHVARHLDEAGTRILIASGHVAEPIDNLRHVCIEVHRALGELNGCIIRASDSTDRQSARLVRWTFALVVVTALMTIASFASVWVQKQAVDAQMRALEASRSIGPGAGPATPPSVPVPGGGDAK